MIILIYHSNLHFIFQLLAPVLIRFLRENLGSAWSQVAEGGWTQVLQAVISVVFTAYDNPDESDEN